MLWFVLGFALIGLCILLSVWDCEVLSIISGAFGVLVLTFAFLFGLIAQVGGPGDMVKYNQTKAYVEGLYGKDITPQERTFVIEKIMDTNNTIELTNKYRDDLWMGWPFQYLPYGDLEKLDLNRLKVPLTRVEVVK